MTTPTEPAAPWTGVLLAGGSSSRMGSDKARLPYRGSSLLAALRERLLQAGAQQVVVSGDYPEFAGVLDRQPGLGPVGGLASVAECLPDGLLLVLAVDMPRVDDALLALLRGVDGVDCAHFVEHPVPMRLQLHAGSRAALQDVLRAPPRERSLQALQQRLGAFALALPADGALRLCNCNTPEQWQTALTGC